MGDLDELLQIVAAVHDAALDPGLWSHVLALVAIAINSNGVVLALDDRRRGFASSYEGLTVPEARHAYLTDFHTVDPVIAFVRRAPPKRAYSDRMAISRAALDRTRFHADFAMRFDYGQCMQAFTNRSETSAGFFVAARPCHHEPFEEAERTLLERLLPHFEQALRVRAMLHRAELERSNAFAALDLVHEGVVLVDASLKIMFMNAEGRRILQSGDGLVDIGAKLGATQAADNVRLQKAVGRAAGLHHDYAPMAFAVSRRHPMRALLLRVAPVSATIAERVEGMVAGAMIFIGDPDATHVDPALVSAVLSLTSAEAHVATLLAGGADMKRLTRRLGVSEATIRTHLQHIYSKTQTAGQSQLVALVNAVPARSIAL